MGCSFNRFSLKKIKKKIFFKWNDEEMKRLKKTKVIRVGGGKWKSRLLYCIDGLWNNDFKIGS